MLLEMRVSGLAMDPFTNAPIVILKDKDDKNTLPIWIGILEASAIAAELEKVTFSRPMTHDLLKDILKTTNIDVKKIEVNDLRDNVYYATVYISTKDGEHTIDARPSDAIAIALRMSSPIFVDMKVIERAKKIELKPGADKQAGEKDWLEILKELSPEDFGKYKM
ncbi:MAG: bifunctional nuclease family protein [Deltaproteobacteria bacterium]|nr:bifunctional nuclease family protein [Deltaproteobacteria bacterium]